MHPRRVHALVAGLTSALLGSVAAAQTKPRARDLGVPFDGTPGTHNAITDVTGVEVGYTTLISGEGARVLNRARSSSSSRPMPR